jgi:cellulase/cellobiase CelA1
MVKALFPIGKTQWSKWDDEQRTAFNEARAAGVPYMDAIASTNALKKKKKNVLDIIEDVAETAVRVADVATMVSPAVSVAKTIVKSATKKKAK